VLLKGRYLEVGVGNVHNDLFAGEVGEFAEVNLFFSLGPLQLWICFIYGYFDALIGELLSNVDVRFSSVDVGVVGG